MKTRMKTSLVNRILKLQARAKQNYQKAEQLFTHLAAAVTVGEVIETSEGSSFQIVDNFASSNSAYRVARVARLELKEVTRQPRKRVGAQPPQAAPAAESAHEEFGKTGNPSGDDIHMNRAFAGSEVPA